MRILHDFNASKMGGGMQIVVYFSKSSLTIGNVPFLLVYSHGSNIQVVMRCAINAAPEDFHVHVAP